MSRFLIATLEVKLSAMPKFIATLGEMKAILTAVGWSLAGSYSLRSGLAGTVVNIWEMSDLEQLDVGFAALATSREWPAIQTALAETVIRETVNFADPLVFATPAS